MRQYACCYAILYIKVEVFEVDYDIFHMNTSVMNIYVFYLFRIFSVFPQLKSHLAQYLLLAYCYCLAHNHARRNVSTTIRHIRECKLMAQNWNSEVHTLVRPFVCRSPVTVSICACKSGNQSMEHTVGQAVRYLLSHSVSWWMIACVKHLAAGCDCNGKRQAICLCFDRLLSTAFTLKWINTQIMCFFNCNIRLNPLYLRQSCGHLDRLFINAIGTASSVRLQSKNKPTKNDWLMRVWIVKSILFTSHYIRCQQQKRQTCSAIWAIVAKIHNTAIPQRLLHAHPGFSHSAYFGFLHYTSTYFVFSGLLFICGNPSQFLGSFTHSVYWTKLVVLNTIHFFVCSALALLLCY